MNVKGSICIDLVKMIKSDKSGACDKLLTDKDRDIINQKILPSIWYPYETYKHLIAAIFEVFAKKDTKVAKEWGRAVCQAVMTTMYAALITKRDPLDFLNKYGSIHKNFYDFGKIEVTIEKEKQVLFKLPQEFKDCFPVYYLIQGWLEHGMELCGAKNIKVDFLTKGWKGQPDTTLRIFWTS
jgi:hypothetical protein